jgi:predicted DNA binding CopG/RHH family protein
MQHKAKQLTVRVSQAEIDRIKEIKFYYKKQGINLQHGKLVRDLLLNFPMD